MSLSVEDVSSLLHSADAATCGRELDAWFRSLASKPYLLSQSFYPCFALLLQRVFGCITPAIPPLFLSQPHIVAPDAPLARIVFQHASFPPLFAAPFTALPPATRAALTSGVRPAWSPIATQYSDVADAGGASLPMDIEAFFRLHFANFAHELTAHDTIAVNAYQQLINAYMGQWRGSARLDAFLSLACELWLGGSVSEDGAPWQPPSAMTLSCMRLVLPAVLSDAIPAQLDCLLVRFLSSSYQCWRGSFDDRFALLGQLWLEAQRRADPSSALSFVLHCTLLIPFLRSMTSIDMGREGSSSRAAALGLVTDSLTALQRFQPSIRAVKASLDDSHNAAANRAMLHRGSSTRGLSAAATPMPTAERGSAQRADRLRVDFTRLTNRQSVDDEIDQFPRELSEACQDLARAVQPRTRAGIEDPSWKAMTDRMRDVIGQEVIESTAANDRVAMAADMNATAASQSQSLDPAREASRVSAAGVSQLRSGSAVCSRVDVSVPVRGDPLEWPATSHELAAALPIIRALRDAALRQWPTLSIPSSMWRFAARIEFLAAVGASALLLVVRTMT